MKKCLFITLTLVMSTLFANAQTLQEKLAGKISTVVAADGSGNFTSINAALRSVADNNPTEFVIFVKNGTYSEKVEVPALKTNITLVGESMENTIILWNDATGSGKYPATGEIVSKRGATMTTSTTHTMLLYANDFILMNVTVKNGYNLDNPSKSKTQAVALNLNADRISVVHCKILGFQDTFYTWGYGRNYIKDCYITGCTDYIFGRGIALFENCILHASKDGSNLRTVTAASHEIDYKYGYVFQNCKITGVASDHSVKNNVYLGRPWKVYGQVAFMNCDMDQWLNPRGWSEWSGVGSTPGTLEKTSDYSEYNSTGAGFVKASRLGGGTVAPWAVATATTKQTPRIMDAAEVLTYTKEAIFAKSSYTGNGPLTTTYLTTDWNPNLESNAVYQIVSANTSPLVPSDVKNSSVQTLSASMNKEGFTLSVAADGIANVELFSVSGALLQSGSYTISNGEVSVPVQLENGIYLYSATINGVKYQGKVLNF